MTPARAAEILGCAMTASHEDVRRAYAIVVKLAHPDSGYAREMRARKWETPSVADVMAARDVLLAKPAQVCSYCRGTGWQSVGLRKQRCVKGCEEV